MVKFSSVFEFFKKSFITSDLTPSISPPKNCSPSFIIGFLVPKGAHFTATKLATIKNKVIIFSFVLKNLNNFC